jgi:NTP pyrophosphatase (non-canonical NTP hydrolase)
MKPKPLSRDFLLKRGFCCHNGCKNCPYNMTFNSYQTQAVETAIYGTGSTIIYPALGLANEAGEVLGKIKKVLRDKDGIFTGETNQAIGDEIGDVLWYMAALARDLGLSLDDIADRNIAKLKDRRARNVIQGSGDNR